MKKIKCFRHGEIGFIPIDKLPENLKETKSKVIMKGSHNNDHSFDNGKLYLKNVSQYVFGYFVSKNTTLLHYEHGKQNKSKQRTALLPNGIYELRRQVEFINSELKHVID